MLKRSIAIVGALVAVLALPSLASAHNEGAFHTHKALSETEAIRAAGMQPSCNAEPLTRFEWAYRVVNGMQLGHGKGEPGTVLRESWRYTQLCAGDDIRLDGVRIPAPKASGEAIPDYISTKPTASSPRFRPGKGGKGGSSRSARDHGWCQVLAYAPTYWGSGNISGWAETNCQNQIMVLIQNTMQRKYNSTQTIVTYTGPAENVEYDGNAGRYAPLGNCVAKASTFRTRAYGWGSHGGGVVDATKYSGFVLPGGC